MCYIDTIGILVWNILKSYHLQNLKKAVPLRDSTTCSCQHKQLCRILDTYIYTHTSDGIFETHLVHTMKNMFCCGQDMM